MDKFKEIPKDVLNLFISKLQSINSIDELNKLIKSMQEIINPPTDTRTISVIHPSRNRPDRAKKVYDILKKNATKPFQYILSIDNDDTQLNQYLNLFKGIDNIVISKNKSCIQATNIGAKLALNEIIMLISDDFDEMPLAWDKSILDATKDKEFWLLKTFDGIQKWIVTLPIMDRKYYEYFGFIYNPLYSHMFCDTEQTAVACYLDKYILRNDIIFRHNHYSVTGVKDAINIKNDSTWQQGENLYIERFKKDFDLPKEMIKTKLLPENHIEWINKKMK